MAYVVIEDDAKADLPKRPKFERLMERVPQGAFDVLISWKLDRWARSLFDTIRIDRFLAAHGVMLHSATEPFDTTSPFGRFCFNTLASVAQLERDLNSERVKLAIHAKAKQHRWPTNRPPLGYSLDEDGYLLAKPDEVKIVRRIHALYRETRSAPETLFRLGEESVVIRGGQKLTSTEIYRVLDNELTVGRFRASGVDDHVEDYRILEDAEFFATRQVRRRPSILKPRIRRERRMAYIDKVFNQWEAQFSNPLEELYGDEAATAKG